MKIKKIKVENFRLLKDFSIDLEDELSLIIGKNNIGKTSLLVVLDKFLNSGDGKKFLYNDFNIDFRLTLKNLLEEEIHDGKTYKEVGIRLRLLIEYDNNDDLEYISPILMDLDAENHYLGLGFDYVLTYDRYVDIKNAYNEYILRKKEEEKKTTAENSDDTIKWYNEFLEAKHALFFCTIRKSIFINKEDKTFDEKHFTNLKDVPNFRINDLINFQYINAKRNVDNKELDKTLSTQTSELYKLHESDEKQQETIEQFQNSLKDTDAVLSSFYDKMFGDIIAKVKRFGGMSKDETVIKIISSLRHRELLKGNTTVVYQQEDSVLPESYNGLGYMNLISMIFDIDLIIKKMQRSKERKPADINILFIEEPEAHTHPQMQYVFIKNIKELLRQGIKNKNGINRKLQYVISSHSAHIVSDCDFNDIKYLSHAKDKDGKDDKNSVIAKNLKDLQTEYNKDDKQHFDFLKQYLTLNRSELFFADKAIFIEGNTERILLPAMIKKIDQECKLEAGEEYLRSQNISILEVGAYSHIFDKFLRFIGLKKCLIITDIDCCTLQKKLNKKGKEITVNTKCKYTPKDDSLVTSNASIEYYLNGEKSIKEILSTVPAILKWNDIEQKWEKDNDGALRLAFQHTEEEDYQPCSFEDAFFCENEEFIKKMDFYSLSKSWIEEFKENRDFYELAQNVAKSNKKSSLAIEILLNSESNGNLDFVNWKIPNYIKDGLLWLRKS